MDRNEQELSKKHYWLGKIHRLLIKSLIRTLNPPVIHTQTHLYLEKIAKLGYKATTCLYFQIFLFLTGKRFEVEDKDVNQEKKLRFV